MEGGKVIYPSLAAKQAEWMEQRLFIKIMKFYRGMQWMEQHLLGDHGLVPGPHKRGHDT